jgi:hypothetical protein
MVREFHGIPASFKPISLCGATTFTFNRDNRIIDLQVHFDGEDLIKQLRCEKSAV